MFAAVLTGRRRPLPDALKLMYSGVCAASSLATLRANFVDGN
jgi:hypothetical protein